MAPTATATIRVLVADDHPLLRAGLAAVLGRDPSFEIVGEVGTASAALEAIERLEPDVAIVEVNLAEGDGIALCEKVQSRFPRVRLLVLTKFTSDRIVLNALRAGAHGFLLKTAALDQVTHAVRTVAAGESYIDPAVAHAVVKVAVRGRRASGPYGLTSQELAVLELLQGDVTNHEIGRQLGISTETVKSHLRHAMRKLGVEDRWAAAQLVQREGLA